MTKKRQAEDQLQAIETEYKGYRFRSRLEARWAVYFDAVGIEWQYEKEGFELPSGRYLPDFWLPQVNSWAEVKPDCFSKDEALRAVELVACSGMECLLLSGSPEVRAYPCLSPKTPEGQLSTRLLTMETKHPTTEKRFYADPDDLELKNFRDVERGVMAARSARFEFGEQGLPTKKESRGLTAVKKRGSQCVLTSVPKRGGWSFEPPTESISDDFVFAITISPSRAVIIKPMARAEACNQWGQVVFGWKAVCLPRITIDELAAVVDAVRDAERLRTPRPMRERGL